MSKFVIVMNRIVNALVLCLPIVILSAFLFRISELSCIDVTDKMYCVLGAIAIITYWVFKWIEWNGDDNK